MEESSFSPRIYNPKKYPENAHARRAVVMRQMVRNGKLDKETFEKLNEEPIDISGFKIPFLTPLCNDFISIRYFYLIHILNSYSFSLPS